MNPEPMPLVLVVDDSREHCLALARTFERARYRVRTAGDGQEALRILGEQPVDLVVTDLQMPQMDGLTLLGRLQGMRPRPAALVLTAFGEGTTYGEAMDRDCAAYLSKPVRRADLLLAARTALASRGIRTPRVSALPWAEAKGTVP